MPDSYDDPNDKTRVDRKFQVALDRYKDTTEADDSNPFRHGTAGGGFLYTLGGFSHMGASPQTGAYLTSLPWVFSCSIP